MEFPKNMICELTSVNKSDIIISGGDNMKKSNQVRLDNVYLTILIKLLEDELPRFYDLEHHAFIYTERNQEVMELYYKLREEAYRRGLWKAEE